MARNPHRYPRRPYWWNMLERKAKPPTDKRPRVPDVPRPEPPDEPLPLPPAPPEDGPPGDDRAVFPPIDRLPQGPFDPSAPLPWDPHEYPPIMEPGDDVFEAFEREKDHIDKLARWLRRRRKTENRKRLPKPDRPKLPPGDRPALPAGGYAAEARAQVSDPQASGLLGPTPLDLYDAFLAENGIRYFRAYELTTHRWRHTKQVAPDIDGQPSSVWSIFYEQFDPKLPPKGVHFLLARCVVPHPDLWASILPALQVLDRFRHWLGEPVRGISGYRLPWYNRQINGSSHSYHMANAAIDFTYGNRLPGGHIDSGLFREFVQALYPERGDGLGRYGKTKGNFLHYDRGMNRHKDTRKGENWWRPREMQGVMP